MTQPQSQIETVPIAPTLTPQKPTNMTESDWAAFLQKPQTVVPAPVDENQPEQT